ncbi:PEP-CTERM sorting domain-containing protein [Nitrosomonas oligotropha]|uniref:PEP-CTERM protein-sorting domain-containing protein n=1 Tax=Nitrosomonas oligotropha TaxID=42354 RepID=A0A1H8RQI8_9PROT|nr:PEP-CTERM sorting domain-containing protein [Nitrosomonas oligotropha]SDX04115.1 PEP-CTERM protein-sorting domain-containing protein [Nitrosomonas oligotropha]SEO68612.1 PEP-CTERM protein-sorting domain-containing protein [Nitrosomonas oligotropha]
MNKNKKISTAVGGLLLCASISANATLESRLGGLAYYDTETNLTWTTNPSPNGIRPWSEQLYFANNYVLDGISGWRMPTEREILDLFSSVTTCDIMNFFCVNKPDQPLHAVDYLFNSKLEKYGGLYRFESLEHILIEGTPDASLWPVHDGDVGLLSPVPEPSTYAMLLAGLGLIGISRIRNANINKAAIA